MKHFLCIFVFCLSTVPALAQDNDDGAGLDIGGQFALGNLAVRELMNPNDPVQQLKTFFGDVRLPLSKDQEQKLDGIVEAHRQELRNIQGQARGDDAPADAVRRLNQEYLKLVNATLTTEQQSAWRHYRVDQIRLRGGLPALQQILDDAKTPLTSVQETSIRKIFENFAQRRTRLAAASASPDAAAVDRLVVAEFDRVVALLNPEQRAALRASRPIPRSVARQ